MTDDIEARARAEHPLSGKVIVWSHGATRIVGEATGYDPEDDELHISPDGLMHSRIWVPAAACAAWQAAQQSPTGTHLNDGVTVTAQQSETREALDEVARVSREAGLYDGDPFTPDARSCPHPDTWFSREVCGCGGMHDYCTECGMQMIECAASRAASAKRDALAAALTQAREALKGWDPHDQWADSYDVGRALRALVAAVEEGKG